MTGFELRTSGVEAPALPTEPQPLIKFTYILVKISNFLKGNMCCH